MIRICSYIQYGPPASGPGVGGVARTVIAISAAIGPEPSGGARAGMALKRGWEVSNVVKSKLLKYKLRQSCQDPPNHFCWGESVLYNEEMQFGDLGFTMREGMTRVGWALQVHRKPYLQ